MFIRNVQGDYINTKYIKSLYTQHFPDDYKFRNCVAVIAETEAKEVADYIQVFKIENNDTQTASAKAKEWLDTLVAEINSD